MITPATIHAPPPPNLSISELVAAVRKELNRIGSERVARGEQGLFQLSKMELCVQFVVTVDTSMTGGFDLKVVSVGGEKEVSSQQVQSVTLTYDILPEASSLPSARAHPAQSSEEGVDIVPID